MVLIHAGTHKTGTTSLQMLFTRHRDDLRDHGILYPETGMWNNPSGIANHTNLAWELLGHEQFRSESGTIDDLIEEVADADCDRVLLSSEEFSCLFVHPDRIRQLKDRFEAAGLTAHIALTIRDVAEYANSLYVTLAAFGLDRSYADFAQCVATERQFTVRQNTYCFDYARLESTFAAVFGDAAVTCVDYVPADAVGPFLEAFDWFFDGALAGPDLDIRSNTTMSRVEELRSSVREGARTLSDLAAEISRLNAELDSVTRERNRLGRALAASQMRLSRRVEGKVRSVLSPRRLG